MKKIVFASYGGGHVKMLIPLLKKLDKSKYTYKIFGFTAAGSILEGNNIDYLGFKDLISFGNDDYSRFGKMLIKDNVTGIVSEEESIAYLGLSYSELVCNFGEEKAKKLYKDDGRRAFYPFQLMRNFLASEQPDLVVSTNSPRAEKAIIDAATSLNIKSVCLVDFLATMSMDWLVKPNFASKVCVASDYVKQSLINYGRPCSDVIVTGNPAFDDLILVNRLRTARNSAEIKKTVLWASQAEPKNHPISKAAGDVLLPRKIDNEIIKVARKHSEINFIIRPHPNELVTYKNLPDNVFISSREDNVQDILASVDLVVTMTSTVGYEAYLLSIPVISITLSVLTNDVPFVRMGMAVGVDDIDDLEQNILDCLSSGQCKRSQNSLLGNASKNVLNLFDDMLF